MPNMCIVAGLELDADAFIHNFMWHKLDAFPDSSWQVIVVADSIDCDECNSQRGRRRRVI